MSERIVQLDNRGLRMRLDIALEVQVVEPQEAALIIKQFRGMPPMILHIEVADILLLEHIGAGAFGEVIKGTYQQVCSHN